MTDPFTSSGAKAPPKPFTAEEGHRKVRSFVLRQGRFTPAQQRAFDDPKIEVLWNAEVVGINGEDKVRSVTVRDTESHQTSELPVMGLFVAIGSDPRTALVKDQLELTVDGTIAVDGRTSKTNLHGVFAAGDVIDPTYRQAITAAASGCVAARTSSTTSQPPPRPCWRRPRPKRRSLLV